MTASPITGRRSRFGWLPASTRDRKREDDSKAKPVTLTEDDLKQIKADSAMRQQILKLEKELSQANAKIKSLEAQLSGATFIPVKEFAEMHKTSPSTITRRFNDGHLIGKREGWAIYIEKTQVFEKNKKLNKTKTAQPVQ